MAEPLKPPPAVTEEQLRQWCLEYDALAGGYPDDEFQGLSVFEFLAWKLRGSPEDPWRSSIPPKEWNMEMEAWKAAHPLENL